MRLERPVVCVLLSLGLVSCFGARAVIRSYYVLGEADKVEDWLPSAAIAGLVRVRNMDADSVYEKYQIVKRKSPYELQYSEANVWAVRPHQMVSDLIAQYLDDRGVFSAVTRELGDRRPQYTLTGELHALELYDSDDLWFSHIALALRLTRFKDGKRMWSFSFDERKRVPTQKYSHAVRAMSELLLEALRRASTELIALGNTENLTEPAGAKRAPPRRVLRRSRGAEPDSGEEKKESIEPVFIPEPIPSEE